MALCRLYFNYYSHITLFYTQLVGLYHTGGIQSIIHWLGNRAKQHTWSLQYSRACYARTEAPSSVFSLKIEVKDHINEIKEHLSYKRRKSCQLVTSTCHDGGIKIHDLTPLTLAAEIRQSHQSKHSVCLLSERTYQTGSIAP